MVVVLCQLSINKEDNIHYIHLSSGGFCVGHLFSFLCCEVFFFKFALFVFTLCLVCPMLSLFVDCPLLIASLFFSDIYVHVCLRFFLEFIFLI